MSIQSNKKIHANDIQSKKKTHDMVFRAIGKLNLEGGGNMEGQHLVM